MANSAYASGFNLDALMVPIQSQTVFTAQENSLYLPGTLIPMVQVPAGSTIAQVGVMGSVAATTITAEAVPGADFDTVLPTDTKKNITLELIAARMTVRDFGGVDTDDMSRILGNSIASAVDTAISAEFANLTQIEMTTTDVLDEFYDAVGAIRDAGETGPLNAVIAASKYGAFMKVIGSSAFAAADVQNAAMRSGFIGTIAGVNVYTSAYLNDTNTGLTNVHAAIFSQDALRGATQGGVKLELGRRPEAVGTDIISSIAFGIQTLDATRGRILIDAA